MAERIEWVDSGIICRHPGALMFAIGCTYKVEDGRILVPKTQLEWAQESADDLGVFVARKVRR